MSCDEDFCFGFLVGEEGLLSLGDAASYLSESLEIVGGISGASSSTET